MMISKKVQGKIKSIAKKMSKLGFGCVEELYFSILQQYADKEVQRIVN